MTHRRDIYTYSSFSDKLEFGGRFRISVTHKGGCFTRMSSYTISMRHHHWKLSQQTIKTNKNKMMLRADF